MLNWLTSSVSLVAYLTSSPVCREPNSHTQELNQKVNEEESLGDCWRYYYYVFYWLDESLFVCETLCRWQRRRQQRCERCRYGRFVHSFLTFSKPLVVAVVVVDVLLLFPNKDYAANSKFAFRKQLFPSTNCVHTTQGTGREGTHMFPSPMQTDLSRWKLRSLLCGFVAMSASIEWMPPVRTFSIVDCGE